jgi:squalene synthase HpnC
VIAESTRPRALVAEAYDWCREFTAVHIENFSVASLWLPRERRRHFHALYAFCRQTDDLGDLAPGDRLALLDNWEQRLLQAFDGDGDEEPVFVALRQTALECSIPVSLFLRLIEANRRDQACVRFATFDDLLEYCSYSATPVGRMVLCALGYRDEARACLADATCIGLQLANFWQDVARDLEVGRVYIPVEDMTRFGVQERQLASAIAGEDFRRLMRFEVERARAFFRRGSGLERLVDRRARADIWLFRRGGESVLDAITAAGYDVLSRRPVVSPVRRLLLLAGAGLQLLRAGEQRP